MGAEKNWGEVATRYMLGLFGDAPRITYIPGSLSGQSDSAFRPPYKGSGIDPKQLNEEAQVIKDTYHPGFFGSGSGTMNQQARQEAVTQLNTPRSYEERAKKGTRLLM